MYKSILKKEITSDILLPKGYAMDILRCDNSICDLSDKQIQKLFYGSQDFPGNPVNNIHSPCLFLINCDGYGRLYIQWESHKVSGNHITMPTQYVRISRIKKRNGVIDWNNPVSEYSFNTFYNANRPGAYEKAHTLSIANDDAYIMISIPLQFTNSGYNYRYFYENSCYIYCWFRD